MSKWSISYIKVILEHENRSKDKSLPAPPLEPLQSGSTVWWICRKRGRRQSKLANGTKKEKIAIAQLSGQRYNHSLSHLHWITWEKKMPLESLMSGVIYNSSYLFNGTQMSVTWPLSHNSPQLINVIQSTFFPSPFLTQWIPSPQTSLTRQVLKIKKFIRAFVRRLLRGSNNNTNGITDFSLPFSLLFFPSQDSLFLSFSFRVNVKGVHWSKRHSIRPSNIHPTPSSSMAHGAEHPC